MLHIGSCDEEPETFKIMQEYATANNLERIAFVHRKVYLSDFIKVEASKLKTVLRHSVRIKRD